MVDTKVKDDHSSNNLNIAFNNHNVIAVVGLVSSLFTCQGLPVF